MSSVDRRPPATADDVEGLCINPVCLAAIAHERLAWYPGPGEYCPQCGEALARVTSGIETVVPPSTAGLKEVTTPAAAPPEAPAAAIPSATAIAPPVFPVAAFAPAARVSPTSRGPALIGLAVAGCALIFAATLAIERQRPVSPLPAGTLNVCSAPGTQRLTADLMREYLAGHGGHGFVVDAAATCDLRVTTESPVAGTVIARDALVAVVNPLNAVPRLSEMQLRGIFSGAIRDWSQVGGPHAPIAAMLPSADSADSRAIDATLLYNVPVDSRVTRLATSGDVVRAVTGADARGHVAIGLVPFRTAVPARVLPLAYLPPPSIVSIANGRYPYTVAIGISAQSDTAVRSAAGLLDFARSPAGIAVVSRDGYVAGGTL